jgi:LmbE family N-acetylglucosaminyl deacetylase
VRVLAVGAHPDDIELGCAGTLLRHVAVGDEVTMLVMTRGEAGPQGVVSRVQEQEHAAELIGASLLWGHFHDNEIPAGRDSVQLLDDALRVTRADLIYVHAPADTHQDHLATSAAVLAAARRTASVLYYQSPSTSRFNPSVYVDVEHTLRGKLAALNAHWSQVSQCEMVDLDAVEAGCRYWGSQARIAYAEPFETARFVWDIVPTGLPGGASSTTSTMTSTGTSSSLVPGQPLASVSSLARR